MRIIILLVFSCLGVTFANKIYFVELLRTKTNIGPVRYFVLFEIWAAAVTHRHTLESSQPDEST